MALGTVDFGLFFLRLILGVIFFYHGSIKVLSPAVVAKGLGWKNSFVLLLGIVEVLGALSVILGIYPSLGALFLLLIMLGALWYKIFRWKVPFASMQATGWEFDLILFAVALVVFLGGSGAWVLLRLVRN